MEKNLQKLQSVHLHPSSPLQVLVWRIRRLLRTLLGKDVLHTHHELTPRRAKLRTIYLKIDRSLLDILPKLRRNTPRTVAMARVRDILERDLGYSFHEIDVKRPWGGYFRIVDEQTDKFLSDFFPGLGQTEARMGLKDVALSPKIMVVLPGRRLSWQYHDRRAERWHFLTAAKYFRSDSDSLPSAANAEPGDSVQFAQGERHRAAAPQDKYAIIAEIWQHTNPDLPSDESDIVRLQDDFHRSKRPRPA